MSEPTLIETRYRRALRWFPRSWRERNEEVVLTTLLDGADADGRTRPSPGELGNLAMTGLATRASVVLPSTLRDMIATVGLATGTVLAVVFLMPPFAPADTSATTSIQRSSSGRRTPLR